VIEAVLIITAVGDREHPDIGTPVLHLLDVCAPVVRANGCHQWAADAEFF
jgi:hypothetical protein